MNGFRQARGFGNSIYCGVHWDKEKSRWAAQIGGKGRTRQRRLGRYRSEEEAARAYDAAAIEAYGERAALNFPDIGEPDDAAEAAGVGPL